jgi:thymidylate kinase
MFVVLEGIDGSGKSTLARMIADKLTTKVPSVRVYHKLSPDFDDPYVRRQMRKLRDVMVVPAEEQHHLSTLGDHHWLFLAAAWFSAVQPNRLRTARASGELVLMDGWYYRLIAKFLYKGGFDHDWLFSLFSTVSEPDLVVILDVEPETAWKRRPTFTPNELGVYERGGGDGAPSEFEMYCRYQGALRQILLELGRERSWVVVPQDETTTAEDTRDEICDRILGTLTTLPK